MTSRRTLLGSLLLIACLTAPLTACLWDYDTLRMEAARFPDTLELITGGFLRHSEAYYQWRVKDRLAKLKANPGDPRLTDDLAVAYDKLGKHDEAAALMRDQLAKQPDRYETHANLGTFLIHGGDLQAGLKHIEKAIEINADAHFGREIYQAQLVRYVLASRAAAAEDQAKLPLRAVRPQPTPFDTLGFAKFLTEDEASDTDDASEQEQERELDRAAAVKGVLGMMRFGHHDSPVLLEVLGDLLIAPGSDDGKRLAARAYLKASYETEGDVAKRYRKMAENALHMQVRGRGQTDPIKLSEVEGQFKIELKKSDQFAAQVYADERRWIREGVDVDEAFSDKYYSATSSTAAAPKLVPPFQPLGTTWVKVGTALGLVVCLGAVVVLGVVFVLRRSPNHGTGKPLKPN